MAEPEWDEGWPTSTNTNFSTCLPYANETMAELGRDHGEAADTDSETDTDLEIDTGNGNRTDNGTDNGTATEGTLAESDAQKPVTVDTRTFNYVDEYDDNLDCPICKCPLDNPVMMDCRHVFCRECIMESTKYSNLCPIDRRRIVQLDSSIGVFFEDPPLIIQNQLDNLRVKCPNVRCSRVGKRSVVTSHYQDECPFTNVPCPDGACEKPVPRVDSLTGTCPHREGDCEHCGKRIEMALLEEHLDKGCSEQSVGCQHCGAVMSRNSHGAHVATCPDRLVRCQFSSAGCSYEEKEKDFGGHDAACVYGLIVRMGETHHQEMEDIRHQLRAAQYKVLRLETEHTVAEGARVVESSAHGWTSSSFQPAPTPVLPGFAARTIEEPTGAERRLTHAVAAGLEVYDAKFEMLEKFVAEVDARHRHVVSDEVGALKEHVRDLRNQLGPLSMSVRWLLDKALQTSKGNGATSVQTAEDGDAANRPKRHPSSSEPFDGEVESPVAMVRRLSNRGNIPRL